MVALPLHESTHASDDNQAHRHTAQSVKTAMVEANEVDDEGETSPLSATAHAGELRW